MNIGDKVCLVTGASAGIGSGIAEGLVKAGFRNLAIVARRKEKLEEVAASCRQLGAKEVLVLSKDLSNLDISVEIIKETVDKFGRLDVLVCNAGIVHTAKVADTSTADFRSVIDFNLTVPFIQAREALPYLRKVKGNIVFISSDSGHRADSTLGAYCASKGGLNMLMRVMALEEASNGVRVNAVSPGAVLTDMMRGLCQGKSEPEIKSELSSMQPLPHVGVPSDIASAVAFVADNDKAAFVTGADFNVDGGISLACAFTAPEENKE